MSGMGGPSALVRGHPLVGRTEGWSPRRREALDRTPPTGRLTVTNPLSWGFAFSAPQQSEKSPQERRAARPSPAGSGHPNPARMAVGVGRLRCRSVSNRASRPWRFSCPVSSGDHHPTKRECMAHDPPPEHPRPNGRRSPCR
jgi:hypothetical protein